MTAFAAGTHLAGAFKVGGKYGWQVRGGVTGAGRGDDGTVLRLGDHSSTSRRLVPVKTGQTNPLYVVRATGAKQVVVAGITVDGGVQGHLYNGIRIEKTRAPLVHDIRVRRVPGGSDVPPGETFDINEWQTVDPVNLDIELDGAGIGASGLGLNSSTGGSTTRLTAHDHPWCKAVALWQHKGGHRFRGVESLNNAFAYGFERCSGTYLIEPDEHGRPPKFRGSARADIHLASDTGRAQIHVIDPDLGGRHLKVLLSKTEMGKPNRQRREDVRLTIDGRDRPDLIDWVTRA